MARPFVHLELQTANIVTAKAFYETLFGWKTTDMEVPGFGAYTMVATPGDVGAGIMQSPIPGAPPAWLAYVYVPDVAAACAEAARLGGRVLQPPTTAAGWGTFSVVQDPTGAVLGLCDVRRG